MISDLEFLNVYVKPLPEMFNPNLFIELATPVVASNDLLLEDGFYLLLEDGYKLILES